MKINVPKTSQLLDNEFIFGVATAAFQIEGGADSRLPCIWDEFCNQPGRIKDGSDGLMACDHFNRWQSDIELISSLNVEAYRFSVAWGRVINEDGSVNLAGMGFYDRLLNALNAKGIKAFVTLYHWDLPCYLQQQGGWLNRTIVDKFRDYADKVSKAFGDRVYSYATLNEPFCSAYLGYEAGIHAPGLQDRQAGRQVAHHLLLAHGAAMQVLQQNCPTALNGIVVNVSPCYAASDTEADKKAAQMADCYHNQWYIQPLLEGHYPDLLQQLPDAERPVVEEGDMALIAQPLDYLGINYYTRTVFAATPQGWFRDVKPTVQPLTEMGWEIFPQGLTEILLSLHQRYRLPPVYITENGAAMPDVCLNGQVDDPLRVAYFEQHLLAVHAAIEQGVKIDGYFAWSLMDNFEWAEGYLKRFGIVYVDYETQQRTLKTSGLALQQLFAQKNAHALNPIS